MGKGKETAASSSKGSKGAPDSYANEYSGKEGLRDTALSSWKKFASVSTVAQTKFLDENLLIELGMLPITRMLLEKVGLEAYIHVAAPTRRGVTFEFLSSLEKVKLGRDKVPGIKFRACRLTHTMTYDDVREALHITKAPVKEKLDKALMSTFWNDITGDLRHGNSKNTTIPNPVLRLLSRHINTNFLVMTEPTKMQYNQIQILWSMTPEGRGVPDWVELFLSGCLELQKNPKGTIYIGGMIDLIVQKTGVSFPPNAYPLDGSGLIDYHYLKHSKVIEVVDKQAPLVIWCMGGQYSKQYMYLPRSSDLPPLGWGSAKDFYMPPDDDFVYLWVNRAQVVEPEEDEGGEQPQVGEALTFGDMPHDAPFDEPMPNAPYDEPHFTPPHMQQQQQQPQYPFPGHQFDYPAFQSWQNNITNRVSSIESTLSQIQLTENARWGITENRYHHYQEDLDELRYTSNATFDMVAAMNAQFMQQFPTQYQGYSATRVAETNAERARLRSRREARRRGGPPDFGGASSSHP